MVIWIFQLFEKNLKIENQSKLIVNLESKIEDVLKFVKKEIKLG